MEIVLQIMTFFASQSALQLVGQMGDSNRTRQRPAGCAGGRQLQSRTSSLGSLGTRCHKRYRCALYYRYTVRRHLGLTTRELDTHARPTRNAYSWGAAACQIIATGGPCCHALNGVAEMVKEYDGIPGGVVRGEKYPLPRLRSRQPI
jgi:hypothetical protein